MKICVAQTRPIKGDLARNIEKHVQFIELAAANGANMIIFPELSLTGYEPSLAQELATGLEDGRFFPLQTLSNTHHMTIGLGMPTRHDIGLCISMILFQPHQSRQIYSKKYLHADEEPFFVSGTNFPTLQIDEMDVGLAICYELSIHDHAELAYQRGANVYVASVAKTVRGVEAASKRLAEIAKTYKMPVLMSNCVGPSEDFVSAGKTAVWLPDGSLHNQLDTTSEGILIFDPITHESMPIYLT
jgi:predicted amidohydrolase